MLTIPTVLTKHTDHDALAAAGGRGYGDTADLPSADLTDEMLDAVAAAAVAVEAAAEVEDSKIKPGEVTVAKRTARVVEAIKAARAGDTRKAVPSLSALPEMMLAYLRANLSDGWLYRKGVDGHLHPWLVTGISYDAGDRQGSRPSVTMTMVANGNHGGRGEKSLGLARQSAHFEGEAVTRKRVSDILTNADLFVETDALRAEYDEGLKHYTEVLRHGFSEQYRYTGKALGTENWKTEGKRTRAKVVHDLASDDIVAPALYSDSVLFTDPMKDTSRKGRKGGEAEPAEEAEALLADEGDYPGIGPVPTHFTLRVFDLATHDFLWVNAIDCERYIYDPSLRQKIVLPEDQRNLLDILTSNLDDFTSDIIEGKSAGNVVLCKGAPGVGKTLTAEVYAELIERPLYSIHSGNLGTRADEVRKSLETVFARSQRWNAVLLLDEADVFVLERGENIEQNAIVAEFLRTLEYFTGLMFMTTNRANNIDDAILSRAAAIIDYAIPDPEGIRDVWRVLATNNGAEIPDDLLDDLVWGFKVITPRDVKMLLRLALRVAKGNSEPLSVDIFARCAMFRGLHFEKDSRREQRVVLR
jgi:hypothetical protein